MVSSTGNYFTLSNHYRLTLLKDAALQAGMPALQSGVEATRHGAACRYVASVSRGRRLTPLKDAALQAGMPALQSSA